MAVKTASQTQWADLATKVRSAIGQGNLIPSFDNMTPVRTFTWSVSDTTYRPVYQIANTGWDHTNMDINVAYRITVTGTNIKQVCDIEEHWHSPLTYPMTTLLNKTLSTSAATTGFRYLRAVYPVSGYLNNTTYPLGSEISNYDSTARTITVEVYLDDPAVTWNETKPSGAIYVDSTHNGNSSLSAYSTRGVVVRKPQSFTATSADSAGYATSCEMYTFNSSAVKAGEALTSGYLAYLADDGKVYKISNTTKNMVCDDAGKIGLITSAVSSGTAIAYNYFRPATNLNSTQVGYISHATLALGNTVYLRCTKDSNGKIHSNNYLATSMSAGYTWCPIGIATATNTISIDARKPMFYTLDSNGKLTHINGKEIPTNAGTITGVSANGTSVATSGVANIPAASTSAYGVTKLSDATNSTSTVLAGTANAVKKAYDLAGTKAKITMTNTDPGAGSTLAANEYIAVYGNSDGAIVTSDIQNSAVSTAKIADGAISTAKLQSGAVTSAKIDWSSMQFAYKNCSRVDFSSPGAWTSYYPSGWNLTFSTEAGGIYLIRWRTSYLVDSNGKIPELDFKADFETSTHTTLVPFDGAWTDSYGMPREVFAIVQATGSSIKTRAFVTASTGGEPIRLYDGSCIVMRVK